MIDDNSCMLFDTGRFNDIAMAYTVLAMRAAKTPHDEAVKVIGALQDALNEMNAAEALERFRV